MHKKILFTLISVGVFLTFSLLVFADLPSDVIELNHSNFDEIVRPEKLILIQFFVPWCIFCQALVPEYEQSATELKVEGIKLAKVDCTVEDILCAEHAIRGYPTLTVYKYNRQSDYHGGRRKDLIVSYMRKQALPAVSEFDAKTLDTFKDSDRIVICGFWDEVSKPERRIFSYVAERLREEYLFGETLEEEAAIRADVIPPAVIVYKVFDEGKDVLEETFTEDSLIEFIKNNSVPVLGEFGPENYASYIEFGLPIAFVFYEDHDQRKSLAKAIKPIAKDFKHKVNFLFVHASEYGQQARYLNLGQQWPAFGILNPTENLKYPFDQSKEVTNETVRTFVERYLEGKILPDVKSGPIPENNTGPVTILVANNFEDIVYDKTKDVFVQFYVPWCGFCRDLAPTWEQLGVSYIGTKDKVIIAKFDATENDLPPSLPFKIGGYPTIKLFKAKDNSIVEYFGDRSLQSFDEFLKKNAANLVITPVLQTQPHFVIDDDLDDDFDLEHDEL